MDKVARLGIGCLLAVAGLGCGAVQLAYEPTGLGWSDVEIDRSAQGPLAELVSRADRDGLTGCTLDCERLERVFRTLLQQARQQTARSATLPWALIVVGLPQVQAEAMPGGQIVVARSLLEAWGENEDVLAFVLAHEMAHVILEHERQALTFARLLLPRQVERSVQDMYAEMDFNLGLLRAMAPALQQEEFEADELGLLLASAAGFDPDRQLAFIEHECATAETRLALVASHPDACARQRALRVLLPLARRQLPVEAR